MYPTISEVNLHAVDIVHGLNARGCSRIEEFLHLLEDSIDIRRWLQVDAVLSHEIVGIGLAELAYLAALLCQLRQEEGDTHEGITAIVACRIDNTAIAFTADDGADLLHECGDIDFTNGRSTVLAAMTLGDIAQRTRRREIANGSARGVGEYIVGHGDEGILLTKHLAVFLNECQTVDIGVDDNTHIVATLLQFVHDTTKVLLQWLRVVSEVAVGLSIEELRLYAQGLQQLGQDDTADAVDAVDDNTKASLTNSLSIDEFECQHTFNVAAVHGVIFAIVAHVVDIGINEVFSSSDAQHLLAFCLVEELALAVEQLQRIPLAGVVAGRDDNATIGLEPAHGQFGGGRCSQSDVHHIEAHAHKGAADYVFHHLTRDACVASNDDAIVLRLACTADERRIGRCEFHNVERVQCVARRSADCSADA